MDMNKITKKVILVISVLSLAACSDTNSEYMTAKDLFQGGFLDNSPESQALINAFNTDNGNVYCVPKMTGAELGELRTALPGLIIQNTLGALFAGEDISLIETRPLRTTMQLALKKDYPCS